MNKFILGLLGLALIGGSSLLGQDPNGPKGEPIPPPKGEPIPAPIIVNAEACPSGHCQKTKTVCCPEHYVKEKQTVVHTFGKEKICLPPCLGLCHCFRCDANDHAHCGHAICTRYLVKKVQVCEKDAVKCNPVEVPACSRHGHRCSNGSCAGAPATVSPVEPPANQPVATVIPPTNK
jgi:hypothetical protein